MAVSSQEQLLDEPRRLALQRGPVLWSLAFVEKGGPAPWMLALDGSAGFSFSSDKWVFTDGFLAGLFQAFGSQLSWLS